METNKGFIIQDVDDKDFIVNLTKAGVATVSEDACDSGVFKESDRDEIKRMLEDQVTMIDASDIRDTWWTITTKYGNTFPHGSDEHTSSPFDCDGFDTEYEAEEYLKIVQNGENSAGFCKVVQVHAKAVIIA